MNDHAILKGSYADLKFIKTRQVAQMHIEFPLEHAGRLVEMFGTPRPDAEVPVVVARMEPEAQTAEPEKERREFHTLPRVTQAGILCNQEAFQDWLHNSRDQNVPAPAEILDGALKDHECAAVYLRERFGIKSRTELNSARYAGAWDRLVYKYRVETGQQTEER